MDKFLSGLKRSGLLLAVLLTGVTAAWAAKVGGSDFDAANQAYVARQYDEAIRIYENLLQNGSISSSVLYNLGSAYYSKGEVGKAVLEYQRALLFEPNATDIATNLAAIREAHGLPVPKPDVWQKPFLYFSLNEWAWIGFAALLTVMTAVFIRGAWLNFLAPERFPRGKARLVSAISVAVLLLAGIGMYLQTQQLNQQVVTDRDAALRVSPFAEAGEVATLKEGDVVWPLKRHNDFMYVKNPAGQKGWIPVEKLSPVLPKS